MPAMSNYLTNALVNDLLRDTAYTVPATLYVALCTATPIASNTGSTISEVTGGNYARQAVDSDGTDWDAPTAGVTQNTNAITWSGVTWSATVTAIAICDASTNGNMLFYGALTASKTVSSGDTFTFAAGNLSITLQ